MRDVYSQTTKPIPEWLEMERYAVQVVGRATASDRVEAGQVNEVLAAVSGLDNKTLEHLRYYGLGEVICALATHVSEPTIWAQAIVGSAECLVDAHFDKNGDDDIGGLRLMDVEGVAMRDPWVEAAQRAKTSVPAGNLLLTDCLQLVSLRRRAALMAKCPNALPGVAEAIKLEVSTEAVGTSSLLNASDLVRAYLGHLYGVRFDLDPQRVAKENPLIRNIKSEKGLRNMKLLRAGMYIAKLRIDEAQRGEVVEMCTRPGLNGLEFDIQAVPDNPPPIQNELATTVTEVLLHDERLGCPAVQCGPVIEKILGAMPDIILRADAEIKQAA
jgi:hypothetical protein